MSFCHIEDQVRHMRVFQNLPLPTDTATHGLALYLRYTLFCFAHASPVTSTILSPCTPVFFAQLTSTWPWKSDALSSRKFCLNIPFTYPLYPRLGSVLFLWAPIASMLSSVTTLVMLGCNYWLNLFFLLDCELLKTMTVSYSPLHLHHQHRAYLRREIRECLSKF